ncbi:MAG: LytTR family DNA-binding domain-containing protein [Bacilli bacterium]|nr:LytTR family DNA-binding domain-containing protein [Bacilli bacterium]MDD2681910.1 LytTR family DNA-binding domain-containing protein [Bacilli bacterium]MDD4482424.1 LytTR family DNA-binding domain-containing protein [Bacilli bacterium]
MFKIIWNLDDFEEIRSKLLKDYNIVLTNDPCEIPSDKVGIILDDNNFEKLKPILEYLALKNSKVMFQTVDGWVQLNVSRILFLESFKDDIQVHLIGNEHYMIKQPLYQLEEILKPYYFVRIGKSFIVSVSKIKYIKTTINAKLDLELINGVHLEVSRSFVKKFKNALGI